MSSLNQVTLLGNVGADPETKSFQNGGKVCNLRLATSESWKDKTTGEKKEKTEWHSVTINSDGLIGIVERFVRKGSKILIQGKLQTRKWQDQGGNDRYSTEIVVSSFDGKLVLLGDKAGSSSGQTQGQQQQYSQQSQQSSGSHRDDLDDDIPF